MKLLQLTTIVRDVQTGTMTAQSFTHSPVRVGRQHGNPLRLDARIVSRRHGAFLFSKDGLQYIDYNAANGSYVDGVRVRPNVPIDLNDSALLTITPFQIVARVDLIDAGRVSNDPEASTPVVALLRPRAVTPVAQAWRKFLGGGERTGFAASLRESSERAERATRIVRVVAERMLAAGSRTAETLTPLRMAATADEVLALLLDAGHADARLAELNALLAELFRPRLSAVP